MNKITHVVIMKSIRSMELIKCVTCLFQYTLQVAIECGWTLLNRFKLQCCVSFKNSNLCLLFIVEYKT